MMRWYKFYRHKTLLIPTWWGDKSLIGTTLSYPPGFRGVRVTRSLVLYVCFVDRCCPFVLFLLAIVLSVLLSFGHCGVCSSSIYGFWLPLWYLQTLLIPVILPIAIFVTTTIYKEHNLHCIRQIQCPYNQTKVIDTVPHCIFLKQEVWK
jgi:hypothetical protein